MSYDSGAMIQLINYFFSLHLHAQLHPKLQLFWPHPSEQTAVVVAAVAASTIPL